MKLLCNDADMPALVRALFLDHVPAVLMELTGVGWHIELLRPHECLELQRLLDDGTVKRG
jgi:hypothetical protein